MQPKVLARSDAAGRFVRGPDGFRRAARASPSSVSAHRFAVTNVKAGRIAQHSDG
jgi:hypothetical protein